jgi:hypothetical protein
VSDTDFRKLVSDTDFRIRVKMDMASRFTGPCATAPAILTPSPKDR